MIMTNRAHEILTVKLWLLGISKLRMHRCMKNEIQKKKKKRQIQIDEYLKSKTNFQIQIYSNKAKGTLIVIGLGMTC